MISKYTILSLGLFIINSGLTGATEVVSPIEQQPTPHGKMSDKVTLPDPQEDVIFSQSPAKDIQKLSKDDFFKLENECDDAYSRGNFKKSALYFITCALDTDMGETYQDILYKINSKSLDWIESNDFDKLATLLSKLEEHLSSKYQAEEQSAKKTKPDMTLHKKDGESLYSVTEIG